MIGWARDHHLLSLLHRATKHEAPFDEKPAFANLTEVLVAGYGERSPNASDWFGSYLEIPSLRCLYGYQLGNHQQDSITATMAELGSGTSPVELLELRESRLYSEDLDRVLKACKNLKTFIYEVRHTRAWCPLRTQDVRNAMVPLEETLENLVLDHPDYLEKEQNDDSFSPMSFMKFDKLRYLKVSTIFLGGINERKRCDSMEVFPVGLEELHATFVGETYHCAATVPALQQVLEQQKHVLPKLSRLTLEGLFVEHAERLDNVKGLVQSARANGVETMIVSRFTKNQYKWWHETPKRGWGLNESVHTPQCFGNLVEEKAVLDVEGLGW